MNKKENNKTATPINGVMRREVWCTRANERRFGKLRSIWLVGIGLAAGLFGSQSARGLSFLPLGEGILPSGDIVSMFQVTFAPGEAFPWHFHPGPLWGVIVSGTLTEDEGCGSMLNVYPAGSAFAETPGRVHRVFNNGTVPVVINFTSIAAPCYANYNITIFVNGPHCEGASTKSHLEKIPACP
jgi:quercetin dioxygenase-like cupin family protein